MNDYEIRVELIYSYRVSGSDKDHAIEQAIDLFLDDLADKKNRKEWQDLIQAEVWG